MTDNGPTTTPPPLLVDARTAASMLSVSPRTLFSLTKGGYVPAVRIGARVLYRVAALERCVKLWEGAGDDAQQGNGGPANG